MIELLFLCYYKPKNETKWIIMHDQVSEEKNIK